MKTIHWNLIFYQLLIFRHNPGGTSTRKRRGLKAYAIKDSANKYRQEHQMALRSVDFNTETVTREARIEHFNILISKFNSQASGWSLY